MIEVTGDVGAVGFCFGGGLAFNVAAEEPLDALVSYYGSALPQLHPLAPRVGAPSLHHFGDADAFIPMDTVARDRGGGDRSARRRPFEIHPGAGHAFDNPAPAFHHPAASAAAWASTVSSFPTTCGPARSTLPSDLAVASRARAVPARRAQSCEGAR